MTGQNNKNFEQIRRGRQRLTMIDVTKNYRTSNTLRVRALRQERTNKTIVGGTITESANMMTYIRGQVFMRNPEHFEWVEQTWLASGHHLYNEGLDLVEDRPKAVTNAPGLFQNI
mgnify:FL=1